MNMGVGVIKMNQDLAFWQNLSIWIRQCIIRCDPSRFGSTMYFDSVQSRSPQFSLPSCIYCRYYLAFKLPEAVRHMRLSITFRHNATKVKKWLIWLHVPWFSNKDSCLENFVCFLGLKFHDLGTQTQRKPDYTVYLSTATSFLWHLTVM